MKVLRDLAPQILKVTRRFSLVGDDLSVLDIEWESSIWLLMADQNDRLSGCNRKPEFEPDVRIGFGDISEANIRFVDPFLDLLHRDRR